MVEKGVLFLAIGGTYAQWAANMAASVRYHNPSLPIAVVVDEKAKAYIPQHEKAALYDYIIDIDPGDIQNEGKFSPGKAKLALYKYSPFEETIYLDVDGLTVRPLAGLFEKCAGKDISSQVNTISTESDESWPCQWMSLADTKKVYGLPEIFSLPEINSSFLYWKKNQTAESFFDVAAQCFLPTYQTTWGKSFPDELAFNVAAALLNLEISFSDEKDTPIVFSTKAKDPSKLPDSAYVLGLYGEKHHSFLNVYSMYERYSNRYFVAVLGTTCPYKYGPMMDRKFVRTGRQLLGKHFDVPEPVKINLPVLNKVSDAPAEEKPKAPKKKKAVKA